MRISILGTGAVGTRLAALFAAAGHRVVFGSRVPGRAGAYLSAAVLTYAESVREADLVVLAVPFTAAVDVVPPLADALAGRIVVDVTNPIAPDYSPRALEEGRSAGEAVAALMPGARMVKAWNTIFADVMTPERRAGPAGPATLFVAADDADAARTVADLGQSCGFAPVLAGPLRNARYLEAMAHLNIHLAFAEGGGTDAAFVYDRRGRAPTLV